MLTQEHKRRTLDHLNDICPDTFDEGAFGPWTFTDLTQKGATWTLSFSNKSGRDCVEFDSDASCLDEDERISSEWFDALNARILTWEAARGGAPYDPNEDADEDV
jgi:hypothetical protein